MHIYAVQVMYVEQETEVSVSHKYNEIKLIVQSCYTHSHAQVFLLEAAKIINFTEIYKYNT